MREVYLSMLVVVALASAVPAGSAVRVGQSERERWVVAVDRIGGFRVYGKTGRQAVRAFKAIGVPLRTAWVRRGQECVLTSESLGIRFVYEAFGLTEVQSRRACATGGAGTLFFEATVTDARWRTPLGLHIRDSLGMLRGLYPKAVKVTPDEWVLSVDQLGPHSALSLVADTSRERVVALRLMFGGH